MDTRKRILRRPVTTAVWLVVIMLASLILGTAASIYVSARGVPDALDKRMTTIAVQALEVERSEDGTYSVNPNDWLVFDEDVEYLKTLPQVKDIDFRYFSGAYIEGLTAKIGLVDFFDTKQHVNVAYANDSYRNAIFIGTVEKVFTLSDSNGRYDLSAFGGETDVGDVTQYAVLNVESVIGLHPDFPLFSSDPNSQYQGKVAVKISAFGDKSKPFFVKGARYAVQGWYDPIVSVPGELHGLAPFLPSVTLSGITPCFSENGALVHYRTTEIGMDVVMDPEQESFAIKVLSRDRRVPAASEWNGTAEELRSDPEWGQLAKEYEAALHSFPVLGTNNLESMYSFLKNEAAITEGRTFTQEEYETGAKVLVMDEGIAKAAGLSVGDTVSLQQFIAAVGEEEGNGSIRTDLYRVLDLANNPVLGTDVFYHGMPDGEPEAFTIVGLYRIENEWKDAICSFTPNTIFMPRKAQIEGAFGGPSKNLGMTEHTVTFSNGDTFTFEEPIYETGAEIGIFMSIALKYGESDSFLARIKEDTEYQDTGGEGFVLTATKSGLGGHKWMCYDQGYDAIKDNIGAVIASAGKLAALMAAGAALLFLMYLLLYQGTERKTLGIMRSLGATKRQTRRYLFASGLALASAGILLGAVLSGVLSKMISAKLYDVTLTQETEVFREMLTESSVPLWVYAAIAAAAIAIAALALLLQAVLIAGKSPRKLMGK